MAERWEPTTEAERAMARARQADDRQGYFRVLAEAPLYLPVAEVPAEGAQPTGPQELPTMEIAGRTCLIVFTSPEALLAAAPGLAAGYAVTDYAELLAKWPNPDWWLTVNPGMELDCYVPIESVRAAADGTLSVPTAVEAVQSSVSDPEVRAQTEALQHRITEYGRELLDEQRRRRAAGVADAGETDPPENDTERALGEARRNADFPAFLEALLSAQVLLPTAWPVNGLDQLQEAGFPWRPASGAESPTIELFTSNRRFQQAYPEGTPSLLAPFLLVLSVWPDPSYALAVDPGGRLEFRLEGEALEELLDSLDESFAEELDAEDAAADAEPRPNR